MANGIRTGDPNGFNKGHSSKFCVGCRVRQTPEKGQRTYQLKRCGNSNKDEDNSPKTLNDKNSQENFIWLVLVQFRVSLLKSISSCVSNLMPKPS